MTEPRLLSKAERDELRRMWMPQAGETPVNEAISIPRLCDTADHWEAECTKSAHSLVEATGYSAALQARVKELGTEVTRLRGVLVNLKDEYKAADVERLQETEDAHNEANKWKSEGDMYGWNFHEGRAGGITWGSIIFYRVLRKLEAILAKAEASPPSGVEPGGNG